MENIDAIVQRLGEQTSRGQAILFTGAGFSYGATDAQGRAIPQVGALKEEIWDLIWPDEPVPEDSTLGDTYAAALTQGRNRLKDLMLERLTVLPESVTEQQRRWLSMPWRRAYTLNIDDLESAVARAYTVPRGIKSVSALDHSLPLEATTDLLYVHLNGILSDVPDVTFADPQYGARQAISEALYSKLAADLIAYPVVFVGTQLRESLFWQYLAIRDARGIRGTSEMRPRSYLVTPDLTHDRQVLLGSYNIEWVKATADEFSDEVLARLDSEAARGHQVRRLTTSSATGVVLPEVADLTSMPAVPGSEYLMGASPEWDDLTGGRAAERAFEKEIDIAAMRGCLVVTGTAGAGTSTVLMRLALRATADGTDVRWIGADHGFNARDLSRHLRGLAKPLVLVVDDADTFGPSLEELVTDVIRDRTDDLIVLGMRATRVDKVLPGWRSDDVRRHEVNVPLLEDQDIDALLEILTRENKLGALKRLNDSQRREVIAKECGRELLVVMVEATSGTRFELKVAEEFDQLEDRQQLLYGVAAIASELRFALVREEILIASGDITNSTLNALQRLVARKLLVEKWDGYAVRHRRIAEMVVAGMRKGGTLYAPYAGLLQSIAIRVDAAHRKSRETKLLTALLSHSRVHRLFTLDEGRSLYDSVEDPLAEDYHFWLQRGALEVQEGSLPAARTYLQQAFDGGENDFRVETEWAYYLIKSAYNDPHASDAAERVAEGETTLLAQIQRRGGEDPYVYHVYGSQMLGWLRRAPMGRAERGQKLEDVKNHVADGCARHKHARDLADLHRDIEHEWMSMAVAPDR